MKIIVLAIIGGTFGYLTGWLDAFVMHYNETNFGAEYSKFQYEWLCIPGIPGGIIVLSRLGYDLRIGEEWQFAGSIAGWNAMFWSIAFPGLGFVIASARRWLKRKKERAVITE